MKPGDRGVFLAAQRARLEAITKERINREGLRLPDEVVPEEDLALLFLNLATETRVVGGRGANQLESKRALKKIDEGIYGVCEACEEEIPEKRLVAVPW